MAEEAHTLYASDIRRLGRMLAHYEGLKGGSLPPSLTTPQRQHYGRPDIVVILLDNVNSGEEVQAAVLEDLTTNETQTITAYGQPTGGYFRLGFQVSASATVEWTDRIDPVADDADTIRGYLEKVPSLAPGDVIVNFGVMTVDGTTYLVNRWAVTFTGRFAGLDLPLFQLDDHVNGAELEVNSYSILEDTGRVEQVRECLGVGIPTPIRAGARALCHWVHGVGYVIGSVEARDYGDYGLMGVSPA